MFKKEKINLALYTGYQVEKYVFLEMPNFFLQNVPIEKSVPKNAKMHQNESVLCGNMS